MNVDETAPSILGASATAPGETLRLARERASLSQEDIAGKLKLSLRQIAAIESGDWSALPERTFTRGFMRNYARLVGVDPDSLGLDQAPSQGISQLRPTPAAIGEIVQEADRSSFGAARWLVPSLLIAALVAGVLYFQGGRWFGWDMSRILATTATSTPSLKSAMAAKAESATEKADALASPSAASSTSSGAVIAPTGTRTAATGQEAAVAAPATDASPAAPVLLQASPVPAAAAGERRISLTFKSKSWTEVRSKGDVIFSETAQPGTREFNGAVPLSFTVGNASSVTVAIDGKPFDMTDLTRNDVARFRVE